LFFFKLYAFILLTSTLVPGINYFVVTTHPLHQLQVLYELSGLLYAQLQCCNDGLPIELERLAIMLVSTSKH